MSSLNIRKYREEDKTHIVEIIKYVISKGDSFTFASDASTESVLDDWCDADKHTFVAVLDGEIIGTFYIKANQTGLGDHIANGSYIVAPEARRQGVGRKMGEFSIKEAKKLGFHAMQFNFVVKSNDKAVKLWQSIGFEIIGEIPEAYRHIENGLTNAYIMYRKL